MSYERRQEELNSAKSQIAQIASLNFNKRAYVITIAEQVKKLLTQKKYKINLNLEDLNQVERQFLKGDSNSILENFVININFVDPEDQEKIPIIQGLIQKIIQGISILEPQNTESQNLGNEKVLKEVDLTLPKLEIQVVPRDVAKKIWDKYWGARLENIQPTTSAYDKVVDSIYNFRLNKQKREEARLKSKTNSENPRFFKGFSLPLLLCFGIIFALDHYISNLSQIPIFPNQLPQNATPLGVTNPPNLPLFKEVDVQTVKKNSKKIQLKPLHEQIPTVNTEEVHSISQNEYQKIKSENPDLAEVEYIKLYSGKLLFPGGKVVAVTAPDRVTLKMSKNGTEVLSVENIGSETNEVKVLYKAPKNKYLGESLSLPFNPKSNMDEALKTFASTQKPVNPEYWNSFKNQKFGFMLSILHTMYIENKLTDEELIDQIKILINQQKYDFNNLSTDMGEFEKTSKEILEGLKNHGIICNQAAILELYVYTKITGQAGGMIAGIAKTDQSGKFNSTMLHAVPIMRTHEGKYIINDPTPTSGPGGEKLAKLVQKMNEDEKNKKQQIWNYLEGFILVGSVGLGIFVLVPKVGEIQQKRADLKMQNLNENVEFVTKNQESLTLLWRLLQPVKYGNEEIDQKYLQKHSETILSNKINYSFDELKSYFSQLQEILTLKLNPKHKLSSEAVQLKTQLKRLYLELKKHPSENQDLIELKTVLESLLK